MNLEQIIEEINKDLDDEIENDELIGWINRCIDDLSPIARQEQKAVIEITETNDYELPDDFIKMFMVSVNGKRYDTLPLSSNSTGYKVWGNNLSLSNGPSDGSIELYYYKRLSHLENMDDVPEIDPAFHDLFILYTIGHHQFMDDELERETDAFTRYNARREEYKLFMNKKAPSIQAEIKNVYGEWWQV